MASSGSTGGEAGRVARTLLIMLILLNGGFSTWQEVVQPFSTQREQGAWQPTSQRIFSGSLNKMQKTITDGLLSVVTFGWLHLKWKPLYYSAHRQSVVEAEVQCRERRIKDRETQAMFEISTKPSLWRTQQCTYTMFPLSHIQIGNIPNQKYKPRQAPKVGNIIKCLVSFVQMFY